MDRNDEYIPDDAGNYTLKRWKILTVPGAKGQKSTRHIFGICTRTGYFRASSPILEETPDWIKTRSRLYYKAGPPLRHLWRFGELNDFWGILKTWGLSRKELKKMDQRAYRYRGGVRRYVQSLSPSILRPPCASSANAMK